jgi:hypothetical protein
LAAKRSQLSIDWYSAPGLAMTVITGALILLVTASFITIFVKREHFVVKASSFVWTGVQNSRQGSTSINTLQA